MQMFSEKVLSLTLAVVAAGILIFAGCNNQNGEEEMQNFTTGEPIEDSTLAVIVSSEYGADTLTTPEFRERFSQVTQMNPQVESDADQASELRRTIVEQFVYEHVLLGEADEMGATVDSSMLAMRLDQLKQQSGGEEQFNQMLEAQGMDEEELRDRLRDQMRVQEVQRELAEEAEEPTEEELADFREQQSEEIRAQHILFPLPRGADDAQEDSVRALAEAVLDSARSGEATFAELAQRHSQDGSASEGGDLGYFSRGDMRDEAFSEAAFALADSGDVVNEPVRTDYGYHLIRKTGEREGQPVDTAQARQMIMRDRQEEAVRRGINELRAKVTVRINPDVVEGVNLDEPFDLFDQS